jgi:hypothetical protein
VWRASQFFIIARMQDPALVRILYMSMIVTTGMMVASRLGGTPYRWKHAFQHVMWMVRVRLKEFDLPILYVLYNVSSLTFVLAYLCRHKSLVRSCLLHVYRVQVLVATLVHVVFVGLFVLLRMSHQTFVPYMVAWITLVWRDTWCDDLVLHCINRLS